MNELVVLADDKERPFASEFSGYLSKWFPQAHAVVRNYSHPEGGGSGNLVFAKIFFPKTDFYTLLGVIRAEGNRVFILSRGGDDHRQPIKELGLEGSIHSSGPNGFYVDDFPSRHQYPSSIPLSAAELLQRYALGFNQLGHGKWGNVLTLPLPFL